jgi:signal transduction histidine kinase/Tfp pilus assembly protein PilF
MKRILIGIFSFLLIQISVSGKNLDSLYVVLGSSIEDTFLVKKLENLSWEYHRTQPKSTEMFAKKSLEVSEKLNYSEGAIRAKNILAVAYSIQGKMNLAFEEFEEAIELAKMTNNQILICRTYNNIGRSHIKIGNFEKAVSYYQKGAKCSAKFGLDQQMSDNLLNMAAAMKEQGIWDTAFKYAYEALKIATIIEDKTLISDAHFMLGILYIHEEDYKEALNHFETALKNARDNNNQLGVARIIDQMGCLYSKQNQPKRALDAHRKAYIISSQINYPEQIILSLEHLAEIYIKDKQYSKAIEKSMEGIHISKQLGALRNVTKLYALLAKSYAAQSNYPQAYIYHTKLKTLSDSLITQERNQKLTELKIKYQLESKEAENQLLKTQQAKDKLTIQKATIASTAFIIALIALCIIAYLLHKRSTYRKAISRKLKNEVNRRTTELKKMNADLTKSNKEMERFNHIASHDLKEPLRNIISFTRLLEMRLKNQDDHVADEYLSFVVANAKQMHTLIEDVLEFSEFSERKIELEEVDLGKTLQQVLTSLQALMEEKTAHIIYEKLPIIKTNEAQIYILFRNIIKNGLLYNNHPTPIIKIDYQEKNHQHLLSITDNGIGIDEVYHAQIFDMFKRLHNRQEATGSGLGLSICQKISNRLGGEILIKSVPEEGSTFTITLPIEDLNDKKRTIIKTRSVFKMLTS